MSETRGGKLQAQGRLSVAIYDTPAIVGKRLTDALTSAGYDVLCDEKLTAKTACPEADVWITKWSFCLDYEFLSHTHPRLGFISATNGVDHINRKAMAELGLRADNCPTFSSIPVAEHAIALAFRSIYQKCLLPPISDRLVVFSEFSDIYAEQAVAQMVMRARQIDKSIERARDFRYLDYYQRRSSEPWDNSELTGSRIGIIGRENAAFSLARMLKDGFGCNLYGYDIPEELEGFFQVKPDSLLNILEHSDYIFLCTSRYGPRDGPWTFDSRQLEPPDIQYSGSNVAVLGTGAIGSIIARVSKKGFNCHVKAFNRSRKPELTGLVEYADPEKPISEAISDSNFIYVALPLNDGTRNLLTAEQMGSLNIAHSRVLINVTRDRIVESDAVYDFVSRGGLMAYATDVVPNDMVLCSGAPPDELTQKFIQHKFVVPTPHEGECSKNSLERLVTEVLTKLNNFVM